MRNPAESRYGVFTTCLLSLAVSAAVHAQVPPEDQIEEVVVRAHPLSAEGLAQPAAVLSGSELERALAPSLGETLQNVPGVHSASFGQAVGRPVIRGLGGPRVKVLEDRIDSLDASVSSPDHMTTVEPFVADSIEVLKGPSTLLYGSGAIGGVVDVHTGRIPHAVPEELEGAVEIRGADNADQRTAAGRFDFGSGNFAIHLDGLYRDADEYEIPGYAESAALRAMEDAEDDHDDHDDEHEAEHDHDEEEEAYGVLPGSELEAQGGAIGASYVGERGFFGLSVSRYEAQYGLPGHGHAHEEHDEDHDEEHDDLDEAHEDEHGEEGNPFLDLEQTRVDLEGGIDAPFAGIRKLNFRAGFNDYEHSEIEGEGEIGTRFSIESWETRIELSHDEVMGFEGAFGAQVSNREFSAIGEEAFIEPVDTQTLGVFWVGQRQFGHLDLETGLRYETVDHDPTTGPSRSFDVGSAALGLIREYDNGWRVSTQLDLSSRAPVGEELYSDGPHLATQSYEIGDASLDEESASNLSVNLNYESDTLSLYLGVFFTEFSDFIYEASTGLEIDELPVYQWTQQDASFRGLEGDLTWQALAWDNGDLAFKAGFDTVRGELDSGENRNLPRISPQRWRVGVAGNWQGLQAELTYQVTEDQDDNAFGELPTEGFDDLRLHIGYGLQLGETTVELFVNGRNLTDDEQRLHTSFIKDFAPRPGRTIEAGVQLRL